MSKLPESVEKWTQENKTISDYWITEEVVLLQDLREFLATLPLVPDNHVAVPVSDIQSILGAAIKSSYWFDEDHPYRKSYNNLAKALAAQHPETK